VGTHVPTLFHLHITVVCYAVNINVQARFLQVEIGLSHTTSRFASLVIACDVTTGIFISVLDKFYVL